MRHDTGKGWFGEDDVRSVRVHPAHVRFVRMTRERHDDQAIEPSAKLPSDVAVVQTMAAEVDDDRGWSRREQWKRMLDPTHSRDAIAEVFEVRRVELTSILRVIYHEDEGVLASRKRSLTAACPRPSHRHTVRVDLTDRVWACKSESMSWTAHAVASIRSSGETSQLRREIASCARRSVAWITLRHALFERTFRCRARNRDRSRSCE